MLSFIPKRGCPHGLRGNELVEPRVLARLRLERNARSVFEDENATVYDRERLGPPKQPVILALTGWHYLADRPPVDPNSISSIYLASR